MPSFRIHRIRETMKEQFRWKAHTGGAGVVKPKDYEVGGEMDAATPYALWNRMKIEGKPLCPGDVLETVQNDGTAGELQIFKYIGFEPAKWWIAEPRTEHHKDKVEGLAESASANSESRPG